VHGAAHEEFVCEVVDELSDWDCLKVSVKVDTELHTDSSMTNLDVFTHVIRSLYQPTSSALV
jgi:hypothetical protein